MSLSYSSNLFMCDKQKINYIPGFDKKYYKVKRKLIIYFKRHLEVFWELYVKPKWFQIKGDLIYRFFLNEDIEGMELIIAKKNLLFFSKVQMHSS